VRLVAEQRTGRWPQLARPRLYRVLANLIASRARHASVVDRWRRSLRESGETAAPPHGMAIADETRRALEHRGHSSFAARRTSGDDVKHNPTASVTWTVHLPGGGNR
jgi:hypothetical protein